MKILTNNRPLAAIICGYEHSGTTLLSEILRQSHQIDSGFEGGFLLSEEASDFLSIEPYYSHLKGGWNIGDDHLKYICSADTWSEVYRRLIEQSPVILNKELVVFDKTPKYMEILTDVLRRVPDVPCIVMVRDPRAVMWSRLKRTGLPIDEWVRDHLVDNCGTYISYGHGWRTAMQNGFDSRILLVQYESLCQNILLLAERIFKFIGLKFDESYLTFDPKFPLNVHMHYVSLRYTAEHKEHLSEEVSEKILTLTAEFKDWFWEDSLGMTEISPKLRQVQEDLRRSQSYLLGIQEKLNQSQFNLRQIQEKS